MFTNSADDLPADFGKVDETNPATKFMLMAERAFKARDEAVAETERLRGGIRKIQEYLDAKEPRVGDACWTCEALLACGDDRADKRFVRE